MLGRGERSRNRERKWVLQEEKCKVDPQLGFEGEEGRGHSQSKGLRTRL
jgi:hypothetical protein